MGDATPRKLATMRFENVFVPYGAYWSTPFARWQGSFASLHPVRFAAEVTKRALHERGIDPADIDSLQMGTTVPSRHVFYGAPWLAGMIGAEGLAGPTISQACATSARLIAGAALEVQANGGSSVLGVTLDRTSNGPHIYYPDPAGPGGRGENEDWVWDNFSLDPWARNAMLETAENVAREAGITREEQDECTLLRYEQYRAAADHGFFERYLTPVAVRDALVTADEGIFPTTAEGLARLKPVREGGTVTYGTQTHPADGNAGMLVTTKERAGRMSHIPMTVQLISYGQARAKKGFMGQAPVPAARAALNAAELSIKDVVAIKTHNPFAVNDIYFSRELDVPIESFNNNGSSLVFGHPQGPTGMRLVIELIEELAERGGGYGLYSGCAAGDTGAAIVLKVSD
jgi:acetyl-CoA acetyltransferase family protein